jgi:DNA (cytosine-5)-methyltransferase 1
MKELSNHNFPYEWNLSDGYPANGIEYNGGKVFSCFACGGGSTMGYKLAGFDVIGCNEIDPKMMEAYVANHNPKYGYLEPIQTFKLRKDLPEELYNLDILDGSPPCSSFSMAGNREKDWGKEKKFREGQAEQVLDNLFFDFIDLANELQPKVVIAENVKGLLQGNAKEYVRNIYREFDRAGYYCQHWLLDASQMGVPQRRERVFFICLRKDLAKPFLKQMDLFTVAPKLELCFNEQPVPFKSISQPDNTQLDTKYRELYDMIKEGECVGDYKGWGFSCAKAKWDKPLQTITANQRKNSLGAGVIHPKQFRKINDVELCLAGSYPLDYVFGTNNENSPAYLIGMSVPPVMTAQIANQVYLQWLSKIKLKHITTPTRQIHALSLTS